MISDKLLIFITSWILENTEFEKNRPLRHFLVYLKKKCQIKLVIHQIIVKSKPIISKKGYFFINDLEPEENICDQSIILHEMIHHYQKNSSRSFDLDQRTIWTLQERQAIYYQNLFLISQKRKIMAKDQKMFCNVKVDRIRSAVQI